MKIYTGICKNNVITRMALHPFDDPPLFCGDKPRRRWPFRVVFRWHSSNEDEPWFSSCRGRDSHGQMTDDEAIAWLQGGEK